jgi:metallophosphoesterase (TIGR00282 family)
MRIGFFGDVVGRSGREALLTSLPGLIDELGLDFVTVNGENAAHGFGITPDIAHALFAAGADCVTTGNHAWDQRVILSYVASEPRLLRPANYPPGTPGIGAAIYEARGGGRVLVANVMGRLFMDALDDPFQAIDRELANHRIGQAQGGDLAAALVDMHAEASSEKMAIGHYLDGRVSAVVGTHTHIPTADAQILPGGTAYQTDAGMCGDYDSVIGMQKEIAVTRFHKRGPGERLAPAEGVATLCGSIIDIDPQSGLALSIRPFRRGGRLAPTG